MVSITRGVPGLGKYFSLARTFSGLSRDPYEVLGVNRNSSQDEIKAQFRVLAKKFHPDLNTQDTDASRKMADITNAYDILTDKRKKAEYDRPRADASAAGSGSASSFDSRAEWVDPSQMFSEFSNIFGRMGRHRPVGRVPLRGDDISASLEISLMEAMNGSVKPLILKTKQICGSCHGSGAKQGTSWTSCKTCKGTGTQRVERGIMTMGMPCVRCSGSGQILEHPCLSCKGESIKTGSSQVLVKIPAGIKNQMELRLFGHGHCGTRGGRPGDLFVTVKIKPDDYFTMIDEDVYVDVPLSLKDALLGTSVDVRQIDGEGLLKVSIPGGTMPGSTRVLKGRGPPKPAIVSSASSGSGGSRGDMILRFSLEMQPVETLTQRQKDIIREFDSIQKALVRK